MASGSDDSAVRSTLGSYRLLGELGRDPLGVLHLACPAGALSFPKWAVVRRMHSGLARDPVMVHAFLAATQAAVRMVHPNIASSFDFGGKMTLPWVAREHLLGVTMIDLIANVTEHKARVPWALALYIVAEAAEGVAAVRARLPAYGPPMGFLTGAVTSSVFLTEAGEVKIIDGCLPLIDGLPLVDSQALPYRPRGPVPVGANTGRADAFGLAVILWELVAGRRLFAGQNDDETNRLVDAKVVPTLRSLARAPSFVDELLQRAFGKVAAFASGFASAADLATELRAVLSAEGQTVTADDVRGLVTSAFSAQLSAQRAAVAEAWLREQAMQQGGEALPDVTSDAEVTRSNNETVRDTTTETAVSRRGGSFGVGFDEVPTVPRSRAPGPPSWRPEAPPGSPALLGVPRIEYLPDTGSPPPPPASPRYARGPDSEPAVIIAPPSSRTERPPPPRFELPPIERAPTTQPSEALRAGQPPPYAPWGHAERPSLIVLAIIGFGLALAVILAVALYRDTAPDVTPQSARSSPSPASRAAPATAYGARHASSAWTSSPTATIPVTSPDDLPRASDTPPGVISHRTPPPSRAPAGRIGRLTVFCTPACDEVRDGFRSLGPSPVFKAPVSIGMHRLRLRVDATSSEKIVTVLVTEGETTVVREDVGE
jgi:hypothetical protein